MSCKISLTYIVFIKEAAARDADAEARCRRKKEVRRQKERENRKFKQDYYGKTNWTCLKQSLILTP